MKTLKYFSLVFLMLFSVRVMAQSNEIKMHTGSVPIGEGKTYYFFDSGGEEEFTVAEDPDNNYRWKTWYSHNEVYTLTFTVPQGSEKGIMVTFSSLLINNDHLIIYEGSPADSLDMSKRIVDLTNNDYSTDYPTFTVMSHGNMNIRFRADGKYRDAGWIAEVKLANFTPQPPVVMRKICDNNMVILPTCNGCSIYYNMATGTPSDPTSSSTPYTIGSLVPALSTYPFTMKAIAYIGSDTSGVGSQTITGEISAPVFTNVENTDYESYYTYTPTDKTNTIKINTNRKPNINDTWYARYVINDTADSDNCMYSLTHDDKYQEMVNPGGTIDYTNTSMTPDFYVHMLIRGTTCPDNFSVIQTVKVEHVYIPKPEITFENGSAAITCGLAGVTIYYTTDGSEPTTSSDEYEGAFVVTPGTTVKAIAVKNGYEDSETACEIYSTGSSVSSSVVLIDDREDHNMSYYQKADNLPAGYPTEYLSSPDPRNVKITYKGGSVANASAVAISALSGEGQNEMIYLKTMEKTVIGMTGDYPYTVISNPFSKRPATGSGNSKTYYGFVGWKVVSGGEYISEYNNDAVLPLDATIHFVGLDNNYTPNCLSAEIVFEATWTTANVQTGTSAPSFNSGTYETNFWVLTGNPGSNSGVTVPANCTMTARYPDGTESWTGNCTRAITAGGNNAKVEFVNMNSTGAVNAAGFTFTMGRGIVNSGNGGALQGCTTDKSCVHIVKIESGKYSSLSHFTTGISSSNTVNQQMIFGCDYDRAKGDNAKLNITGTMQVGASINLNRSTNNTETPHIMSFVKSGNFNSSQSITNGNADESYYFSIRNTYNILRRVLVVEGGHLRSIAGGIDTGRTQYATSPALDLRIRGNAQIDGVVYGAATFAKGKGIRTMIFTGGTINGWIAGGCNGTQSGSGGELYGNTYIYIGGNTQVGNPNSTISIGDVNGGNVFGAGKGLNSTDDIGQVASSTIIITDSAVVKENVYGGGNFGYIAAGGKSDVFVLNGTVKGSVFGGANQRFGQTVNITMQGGTVEGSVYGGSNITGTINDNVTMNINGGEVKGNVHGGGYGENTNVAGDVVVTIGSTNPQDAPTIGGDVYGGGALGKVNTTNGTAVASKNTTVTVNNGNIAGNVYGGGLGKQGSSPTTRTVYLNWTRSDRDDGNVTYTYTTASGGTDTQTKTGNGNTTIQVKVGTTIYLTATGDDRSLTQWSRNTYTITARYDNSTGTEIAQASSNSSSTVSRNGTVNASNANDLPIAANVGTATVEINGGTMSNVFGCNNLNGSPQGSVEVNFNGGEAVNVYGGGNLADYLPNTTLFPTVNITGGTVTNNVYGGGAFAKVNKTIVNMTGGEANSVYAGAQGDDKSKKLVSGNKTVNMKGGTAIMVYGGSFTCLDTLYSFVNISGGRVKTHVFGSGYFGDMHGDCYVYIGENAIKNTPNNNLNADKGTHNSEKPIWIESNVYAGANWGSFEGTFGEATITGASNIYIDGTGYNQDHGKSDNYMIIGGSVYGSGTSCAAGKTDHQVIVRNYGKMTYPSMTRSLRSIQRVTKLVLDSSNIEFTGQGDISSMDPTVEFGMCNIDTVYAANTSNMALSKPLDMVNKLGSYTCANVYAATPSFTENNYSAPKNGIVINNGGYLMVRYDIKNEQGQKIGQYYGELQGYFYMREPGDDKGINNEGYIFARPKIIKENGESAVEKANTQWNVFAADGGFVDFDAVAGDSARNTFDVSGNKVRERKRTESYAIQMPYTNRTDAPEANRTAVGDNGTDYRFWRFDPDTVPTVTREVVFVVKADEQASSTSTKFLTTTGAVQFPPSLGENNKYKVVGLTWGADGKDCNPANITKTGDENTNTWEYYDDGEFKNTTDSTTNNSLEEYYSNPNSTFGFLMQFAGNLKEQDPMILDNNSFENYFNGHYLAEVDANGNHSTELPELDFLVTYSDRLSQNEMWAEARMVIDEVDANGNVKQRIYLNISVTTVTKFGQDVETYVYASTAGDRVSTYTAQLNLPTFALDDNTKFYATFTIDEANKPADFGKVNGTPVVSLSNYDENTVKTTTNLALQFNAASNEDNTNGWYHKGNSSEPNQAISFDFNKVLNNQTPNDGVLGASDGRKYTTIQFDLLYDPTALKNVSAFGIGQKHVGDLTIKMVVDNIEGGINTFNIIVHVYVTGPTKFYYLDGVAGKDGNNGMFPDKAKKTLNGVINASGYTVDDPIFVVNGVEPKSNGTLTWDASRFIPENQEENQDLTSYQVKVYRYPGSHPKENGDTNSIENGFFNGMYTGQIVNVPAGTQFTMHNVNLSGGSDLDTNSIYNPNKAKSPTLHADYPLVSIAAGAKVTIENSSLIYNNNTSTSAIAGAIYNAGLLTIDGVTVKGNKSVASSEKGAGIYQADSMILGNTGAIVIEDQVYLDNKKMMSAPKGFLADGSKFSDILVYSDAEPIDTSYSGRVIVRYPGFEPTAPKAPFWKTLVNGVPQTQSSILKNRKAAEDEENYESDKYELNSTLAAFEKANGGDENAKAYITYKMKEEFTPAGTDIIMYTTQANLPVELLYFTAECMGEATQLQWSTASETNNEYFTIERSSDAVNYEEVARIQGAGTTSQRSDYSFMVDNNSNAITYYRLRQTDIDGKYEIFAPIAIQCQNNKAATEISIYPVPANDQVNIFSSNSPMTRIEIFSIMGAKVAEEPAEGNQTTLHIGNLATGVYAVKVFTEDGQVSNVRLIKK